jgi:hypothetical protein
MVYGMIGLAVLTRFIPHLPHFSPVYGALLLGGAHLKKRDSVWFPVLLLGARNVVLTNFVYHMSIGRGELIQMVAFASLAMTGWILRKRFTALRGGSISSAMAFLAGGAAGVRDGCQQSLLAAGPKNCRWRG